MLKNKKAQIGETLTWVVAFTVIFFIMFIFTMACAALGEMKDITGDLPGDITVLDVSEKYALTIQLTEFLKQETKFDGENVKIADLIAFVELNKTTEQRFIWFKHLAQEFLEENFPIDKENYRDSWLRIYSDDEVLYSTPVKYGLFWAQKGEEGTAKKFLCNPLTRAYSSATYVQLPHKKIVLCTRKWTG